MTLEIRRVRSDELPAFIDSLSTAFLDRPDIEKVSGQVGTLWDLERVWGAFEGGEVRGTFRSWATEVTVPGGATLPAAAIAAVTVVPTHRRRGILRRLVAAEHGAARERGEAVCLLYASEYPIYGRFGYGPACRDATWTLDALTTAFHGPPATGVELVRPSVESAAIAREVFDAARVRQVGEIRRRDYHWELDLGLRELAWGQTWKGFLAIRRDGAGRPDGFVRYRAREGWERGQQRGVIDVDDLHTLTDEAYAALWRFLADVDLVATVKAPNRSLSERLPWLLTNGRAANVTELGDGMWVRLLDLPRALAARRYERQGALTLEVIDPEAGDDPIRIELEAGDGGATCRTTSRSADLTLDVAALGAAYLGGVRLRDAVLARGADEHRQGALAEADALFRTADEPWCSTHF